MNTLSFILVLFIFNTVSCDGDDGASSNRRTVSGSYNYNIDFKENPFEGNFGNKIGVKTSKPRYSDIQKQQRRFSSPQSKNIKPFFPPIFQDYNRLIPFTTHDAINVSLPVQGLTQVVYPKNITSTSNLVQQKENKNQSDVHDSASHHTHSNNSSLNISTTPIPAKAENSSELISKPENNTKKDDSTGISNLAALPLPPPHYKISSPIPVLILQPASHMQYIEPRYSTHSVSANPQLIMQPVQHILLQADPVPANTRQYSYPVSYTSPSTHSHPAASPAQPQTSQYSSYILPAPQTNSASQYIYSSSSAPTSQSVPDSSPHPSTALAKEQTIIYQHPQAQQPELPYYPDSTPAYYSPTPTKEIPPPGNFAVEDKAYSQHIPNINNGYAVQQHYGSATQNAQHYPVPQETSLSSRQVLAHAPADVQYVYPAGTNPALSHYKSNNIPKVYDESPVSSASIAYIYVPSGPSNEKYSNDDGKAAGSTNN